MGPPNTTEFGSTLRERLLKGEPVRLREALTEDRIIMAEWISEAAKNGVRIDIRHGIIRGTLNLKHIAFEREVSLIRCTFEEPADFSYTRFKRPVMIYGTRFVRGANFEYAIAEYDIRLVSTEFIEGKARFSDIHVLGSLSASRLLFAESVKADFSRARIEKAALFWSTTFHGQVDFARIHIGGEGDFSGAVFKRKVNFNPAKIEGGLFFRAQPEKNLPPARFDGEADFGFCEVDTCADFNGVLFKSHGKPVSFEGARIRGFAEFSSAEFDCEDKMANFSRARIEGSAFFVGACFASEASFVEIHIAGSAEFSGVNFRRKANFNGATIAQNAFFRPEFSAGDEPTFRCAVFECEADFTGISIGANAEFWGAEFKETVSFNSAKISHLALFRAEAKRKVPATTFGGGVDFTATQIGSNAEFAGARFTAADKLVTFEGANIGGGAVFTDASFAGETNYERIFIRSVANFVGVTFGKKVRFSSAVFGGAAFFGSHSAPGLASAKFEDSAEFVATKFEAEAVFDKAHFTATDKWVRFEGAEVKGNAFFRGATFFGPASFLSAHMFRTAAYQGAEFKQEVSFNAARIDGPAFFRADSELGLSAASFAGRVDFIGAKFGLEAIFDLVQFAAVDKEVSFDRARVRGNGWFRGALFAGPTSFRSVQISGDARFGAETAIGIPAATFESTACFEDARIEASAEFNRVEFKGRWASFENANIEAKANFRSVIFRGSAIFQSAIVGATASYQGATFGGHVSFNSIKIGGGAFFRADLGSELPASRFDGGADFIAASIESNIELDGAQFNSAAPVDFGCAQLGSNAFFRDTQFAGPVSFIAARITGQLNFQNAAFNEKTSFGDADIGSSAIFQEVRFLEGSRPSFVGTKFGGGAFFQDAVFKDAVRFSRARFDQEAIFHGVRFEKRADFGLAHFRGSAWFSAGEDRAGPVFEREAIFNGARIDGYALFDGQPGLNLPAATFEGAADFVGVKILWEAKFGGARFMGVEKPIKFNAAEIGGGAYFGDTVFAGPATFITAKFSGFLIAKGAVFKSHVSFNSAKIGGNALFSNQDRPTTFEEEADFIGAQFGSTAEFDGAQFKDEKISATFEGSNFSTHARFSGAGFAGEVTFAGSKIGRDGDFRSVQFNGSETSVNFESASINGNLKFGGSCLKGEASFFAMKVGGMADFTRAIFGGDQPVRFDRAHIEGNARFDAARFAGESTFIGVRIDSQASFSGVRFTNGTRSVTFDGAEFTSIAFFLGSEFAGEANFRGTYFGASAVFSDSRFISNEMPAVFDGAKINGEALFSRTIFAGEARFEGANFCGNADFSTAYFFGKTNFVDALFRVVRFSTSGFVRDQKQFNKNVDLRGCSYERIEAHWPSLLANVYPFDRQPYKELEKAFRSGGDDREADKVYLTRREDERKEMWSRKDYWRWLPDRCEKCLINYGVRPYRLVAVAILCFLLGIGTLSHKDAATPKDRKAVPTAHYSGSLSDAFWLSLDQFLPVELPMGSQWKPSDQRVRIRIPFVEKPSCPWPGSAKSFATVFLKLPGWILIPLGLGALAGLLRRRGT